MDPEKQPLLKSKEYLRQRFRPLTSQEVLQYRYDETWQRFQLSLLLVFWSLIAASVVAITWLLAAAPCVDNLGAKPTVSPAHLSLVPLVYGGNQYPYNEPWHRVQLYLLLVFWSFIAASAVTLTWLLTKLHQTVWTTLDAPTAKPESSPLSPQLISVLSRWCMEEMWCDDSFT